MFILSYLLSCVDDPECQEKRALMLIVLLLLLKGNVAENMQQFYIEHQVCATYVTYFTTDSLFTLLRFHIVCVCVCVCVCVHAHACMFYCILLYAFMHADLCKLHWCCLLLD